MTIYTPEEFRTLWEGDEDGGGLTYEDVADCAKAWGLFHHPHRCDMEYVLVSVLRHANVDNPEDFI